ncbi:AMP-binding protein [Streptomyces sp. NPDC046805]|uniref:AMP-binding protein n=1 Tax=Streptomyces sp. NPDC046805 TaxID=3155134 RepID=UPI0033DB8510
MTELLPLTHSLWPADTSLPVLELTPGDALREASAAVPDRIALAETAPPGASLTGCDRTDRTWTYARLLDDAERAATWLAQRFEPGAHVAVWAPNVPEWIVLQYGAALAGLVLVTANPALRDTELEYVLAQSRSVAVFHVDSFRGTDMAATVGRIRPRLPLLREAVSFTGWSDLIRAGKPGPLPEVGPGDPAQIQYTSGTTGFPKGALLHHRGLVTNAHFFAARADLPDAVAWVTAIPLFHTSGSGLCVLGTALRQGTLVLPQFFEPELHLRALQNWRAGVFGGVPSMYTALLAHPDFDSYDLTSCRVVMSGGDIVPPMLVEEAERRFGARFSTVYGQTELSPVVAQTSPGDLFEDKANTTGRPLPGAEVKIADPAGGDVLPVGEPGEVCVRGYQLMLEYYDLPEATAETVDSDGWLHTGDLAVMDDRGFLRITGRIKDMIIRGGENIYPREIEAALACHPGVATAVVVAIPDPDWGEQVVAVVRPVTEANPPTSADLHAHTRGLLAPHKTPRRWYLADTIPVNAMGKTQKFVLRTMVKKGELPELP